VPIREGLGRLDGVAFISKSPDVKAGTCDLRLKDGRFMDPLSLSNHVYNIRVGARVRGVEASVAGLVDRSGTNFVLKISGTNTVLQLAPLSRKVQHAAKQPQPATSAEASAFSTLTKNFRKPRAYAVTGPLRQSADGSLILEVRDVAGVRTSSSPPARNIPTRF
jgi:hypothetical protein